MDHPSGKDAKEEVLKEQVDDLQKEMNRLNKRLVAMQANVQNTCKISPTTTADIPTPSFSRRSGNTSITRKSLSSDQYLRNQSLRQKKGMEDVFVPCEIDFVSNEPLHCGKDTNRPEIRVSNVFQDEPPVREIETRKAFSIDNSSSTGKVKALYHYKQSHLQVFGDAESTTSSQRSTFTMKNGRKVRRIVRKVRAAPSTETASKTDSKSRTSSSSRERQEAKPSLSSTIIRNYTGRSTKRPASLNEHSQMELSDIFIDDSNKPSYSRELSVHCDEIKNRCHFQTYPTDAQSEVKSDQIDKTIQKDFRQKINLLADIRSGIKLSKVVQPSEQNFPSKPNCRQRLLLDDSRRSQIQNSAATSCHSTANLLEHRTAGTSQRTTQNPKNSLLEGIKAGFELKQVDKSVEKPLITSQNPKSTLLEGIKAGVNLKQVNRTAEKSQIESQNLKSTLLEGIKAGVKLKQIDRSSLQIKKKKETPMSALLANIQKRKQECLRQEQPLLENPEQIAIDW